ncbi:hypothetical protein E4U42_001435 [Claviceps africana]|uniref:Uncharacterized protein n=1 Tax=Claviceps africana TaxID=83212 RepID=A0A8K0NK42_9HYPO|nr:hypothetical protein E4U42_001435 [Claviceps africana]
MLPLSLLALAATLVPVSAQGQPCGLKIAPCPSDQHCVPDSPRCNNPNRCRGTCQFRNTYLSCGGFRTQPVTCPEGTECRDDPRVPRGCGLACDAPGICMPTNAPSCAGFAGRLCRKGLYCYDVPDDGCDPQNGGADCAGICL